MTEKDKIEQLENMKKVIQQNIFSMGLRADQMRKSGKKDFQETVRRIEEQIKSTQDQLESITKNAQKITKTLVNNIIALQTGTTVHRNKRGEIHCEDGPAVITKEFDYYWALDGDFYPFDEWCQMTSKTEEEITQLKLKY